MTGEQKVELHRGLKGVYFARSAVSSIDGRAGDLRYRGYSIHDLATRSNFEETAYLLLHGELPTRAQLNEFDERLKSERKLPDELIDIIRSIRNAHPMEVLRTCVSALGAFESDLDDRGPEAVIDSAIRLTSQVPMIVAAHDNIRNGKDPVSPLGNLRHAAHFLYLLKGVEPSVEAADLFDTDLVLHAEHGSNASSFAARVVTGTDANVYASITAAVAALSGPAHGGAAENVMKMAQEVGKPENAAEYVKSKAREPRTGDGVWASGLSRRRPPSTPYEKGGAKAFSRDGPAALVRNPAGFS